MLPYKHTVHYYETDKMGIVHHSNYIRWMEEARIDYLKQLGWAFDKLEELGISSPVLSLEGRYLLPTSFADSVDITVTVLDCRAAKLLLSYDMINSAGHLVYQGQSEHGFLSLDGRPINLKKTFPDFYRDLTDQIKTPSSIS